MKIHNFLISTTRPKFLDRQLSSFSGIAGSRKIRFYVFNDKDDKSIDIEFLRVIKKIRIEIPVIDIQYFNINTQLKLLTEISQAYAKILKVNENQILECFKEDGVFSGIRSIQNKSIAIFYYLNSDCTSIIHKLDDDIFPYEADRQGHRVTITIKENFFKEKELSIGTNIRVFSGSNYTIDSPSPLVNYADFTEFLCNFYNTAKDKSENALIGDDILKISPKKVKKILDPLKVLDICPIEASITYGEAASELQQYADILLKGNSRIVINDNAENRSGKNKFFPGGCISFLYKNIPTLTPAFGNQDLLWELIELTDGKTLISDGYVGHIKSTNDRPSILSDLKDTSYKHQTSLTYSVYQYLVNTHQDKKSLIGFQTNFTNLMSKWLEEAKRYTEQIIVLLDSQDNWYSNETKYNSTTLIRAICRDFLKNYNNIKSNYSFDGKEVSGIMSTYFKNKKVFDNLLRNIIKTK